MWERGGEVKNAMMPLKKGMFFKHILNSFSLWWIFTSKLVIFNNILHDPIMQKQKFDKQW